VKAKSSHQVTNFDESQGNNVYKDDINNYSINDNNSALENLDLSIGVDPMANQE
jgi:hypothetical protein